MQDFFEPDLIWTHALSNPEISFQKCFMEGCNKTAFHLNHVYNLLLRNLLRRFLERVSTSFAANAVDQITCEQAIRTRWRKLQSVNCSRLHQLILIFWTDYIESILITLKLHSQEYLLSFQRSSFLGRQSACKLNNKLQHAE